MDSINQNSSNALSVMCEDEWIVIINGRPITKVSDDAKDLNALTPNHLLLLRTASSVVLREQPSRVDQRISSIPTTTPKMEQATKEPISQ